MQFSHSFFSTRKDQVKIFLNFQFHAFIHETYACIMSVIFGISANAKSTNVISIIPWDFSFNLQPSTLCRMFPYSKISCLGSKGQGDTICYQEKEKLSRCSFKRREKFHVKFLLSFSFFSHYFLSHNDVENWKLLRRWRQLLVQCSRFVFSVAIDSRDKTSIHFHFSFDWKQKFSRKLKYKLLRGSRQSICQQIFSIRINYRIKFAHLNFWEKKFVNLEVCRFCRIISVVGWL